MSLLGGVKAGSTNGTDVTTSSVDTTGAQFLAVVVADQDGTSTMSDSKGNTWARGTAYSTGNGASRIHYCSPTSVGSGHTFTCTGPFPSIDVLYFSNAPEATPLDQQNGATSASANTLSSGSITPSQNNTLLIGAYANSSAISGTPTADAPFTTHDNILLVSSQHYTMTSAYVFQTSAVAQDCMWRLSGGGAPNSAAAIASFKVAADSAAVVAFGPLLGMAQNRVARG